MRGLPNISDLYEDRYEDFTAVVHFPMLRDQFISDLLKTREGAQWLADFTQAAQTALAEHDRG